MNLVTKLHSWIMQLFPLQNQFLYCFTYLVKRWKFGWRRKFFSQLEKGNINTWSADSPRVCLLWPSPPSILAPSIEIFRHGLYALIEFALLFKNYAHANHFLENSTFFATFNEVNSIFLLPNLLTYLFVPMYLSSTCSNEMM